MSGTESRGLGEAFYRFRAVAVVLVVAAGAAGLLVMRLAPPGARGALLVAVGGGLLVALALAVAHFLRGGEVFGRDTGTWVMLTAAVVGVGLFWVTTMEADAGTVALTAGSGLAALVAVSVYGIVR